MANAKYAIFKAKVENEIVELLVKSSVKNIYLEDGTTTLASKLAEMVTAIDSKTTADAVATQISNAIDALIDGAPGTYDTLKEISDYLTTHQDEYTALVQTVGSKASQEALNAVIERVSALEGKMTTVEGKVTAVENKLKDIEDGAQVNKLEKVKVNGVEQTITEKAVDIAVPTGALASKDQVAESDLSAELLEKVNASAEGNHSHANKTELDKIADGDKAKWDAAAEKAHEHANKDVIDGITAEDITAWNGKTNTYIQSAQPTEMQAGDIWVQLVDVE